MSAAGAGAGPAVDGLCLSCGLCCDGSLFWAVALEAGDDLPGSAAGAGGSLPQPCRFHAAGACEIYPSRPRQCRAFVCHVLEAVQNGRRTRAWAEARIEAMRHLLAGLDDVLPGTGALYARAAAYLEDAGRLPDEPRIRARIAVYEEMIGDFRPLSQASGLSSTPG